MIVSILPSNPQTAAAAAGASATKTSVFSTFSASPHAELDTLGMSARSGTHDARESREFFFIFKLTTSASLLKVYSFADACSSLIARAHFDV